MKVNQSYGYYITLAMSEADVCLLRRCSAINSKSAIEKIINNLNPECLARNNMDPLTLKKSILSGILLVDGALYPGR